VRCGALHPCRPGDRRASTKTFLAQITANYLVGLALAQARGTKYPDEVQREYRELEAMPDLVARVARDDRTGGHPGPSVRPIFDGAVSWVAMSATRWRWRAR